MRHAKFLDNSGSVGTDITLRVLPGDPNELATEYEDFTPDDSHKVIVGPNFYAVVTGDFASYSKDVNIQQIADTLGGEVKPVE